VASVPLYSLHKSRNYLITFFLDMMPLHLSRFTDLLKLFYKLFIVEGEGIRFFRNVVVRLLNESAP
jgi:hypothetical protein